MGISLSTKRACTKRGAPFAWCRLAFAVVIATMTSLATPSQAWSAHQNVDLELVLAVDVSPSMSRTEQQVQRDGYVSAFRNPDIARAIGWGVHGRIAVTYVEWAGPDFQRIVVPWTLVGSRADAKGFADALASQPIERRPATSIAGALSFAGVLLARAPYNSARRVVDVSGDGTNNAGPPVTPVRDALVAAGITINGLPIGLPADRRDAFTTYNAEYLRSYFVACVIGGPDAFVIGINDISRFGLAIRQKLVREIAGMPTRPMRAPLRVDYIAFADCLAPSQRTGR